MSVHPTRHPALECSNIAEERSGDVSPLSQLNSFPLSVSEAVRFLEKLAQIQKSYVEK
jgi:hypothetical protein